ncbi:hypothetical protein PMAYCL1PPCAC_23954, partial [Pristionchus mayeri]
SRVSTILRFGRCQIYSKLPDSYTNRLLSLVIILNIKNAIDEDLFVPMFSRSSMDNPHTGCRSFLDRQFWSAIKLMQCVSVFSGVLSDALVAQLCFSISNRVCVIALQLVDMCEPHVIIKTRALLSRIRRWIRFGRVNELRPLLTCLSNVQKCHSDHKDLMRETQSAIEEIQRSIHP